MSMTPVHMLTLMIVTKHPRDPLPGTFEPTRSLDPKFPAVNAEEGKAPS